LLPSDILGVSVLDPREQTFRFHEGPIFTHILLADEINRASPRTQSALLEAMAESQVSVDGVTYRLPELFFVIATQNPVEFRGTYPLPEAQMDRASGATRSSTGSSSGSARWGSRGHRASRSDADSRWWRRRHPQWRRRGCGRCCTSTTVTVPMRPGSAPPSAGACGQGRKPGWPRIHQG
jgi:hypothetical protein